LRIECGLTVFARLGWPVEGFVAPAWLAGRGTLPALRETPLRYMSTQGSLWMVHEAARYRAPCLTASTRASWRRGMSAAIIPAVRRALRNVPVVRVALHPNDAKYENITDLWRGVIGALLCEREPLTKADALRRLHAGQAPATSGSR
jgi:predicted deacetylase